MYFQLALLLVMFLQICQTADVPEKLLELGKSGDLKAQMSIASRYHSLKRLQTIGAVAYAGCQTGTRPCHV